MNIMITEEEEQGELLSTLGQSQNTFSRVVRRTGSVIERFCGLGLAYQVVICSIMLLVWMGVVDLYFMIFRR